MAEKTSLVISEFRGYDIVKQILTFLDNFLRDFFLKIIYFDYNKHSGKEFVSDIVCSIRMGKKEFSDLWALRLRIT